MYYVQICIMTYFRLGSILCFQVLKKKKSSRNKIAWKVENAGEKYSTSWRMVFSYVNEMNMNNNRSEDLEVFIFFLSWKYKVKFKEFYFFCFIGENVSLYYINSQTTREGFAHPSYFAVEVSQMLKQIKSLASIY